MNCISISVSRIKSSIILKLWHAKLSQKEVETENRKKKKKNGSKMLISIKFKVFPLPQNSKKEVNIISIFM